MGSVAESTPPPEGVSPSLMLGAGVGGVAGMMDLSGLNPGGGLGGIFTGDFGGYIETADYFGNGVGGDVDSSIGGTSVSNGGFGSRSSGTPNSFSLLTPEMREMALPNHAMINQTGGEVLANGHVQDEGICDGGLWWGGQFLNQAKS